MVVTIANACYVRFEGGHVYVDRSNGAQRREVFLEISGISDRDRAAGIGARWLAALGKSRTTDAYAGTIRAESQVPGAAIRPGDKIDGHMVMSLSSQLVDDGDVKVVPELGDPADDVLHGIQRGLARASKGVRSEYGKPSVKRQNTGTGTDTTPPTLSQSGEVEVTSIGGDDGEGSPVWRAPRPIQYTFLEVELEKAGTSTTSVRLCVPNGSLWLAVASADLVAGEKYIVVTVNRSFPIGSQLVHVVSRAGTGAEGLTVTPRCVLP